MTLTTKQIAKIDETLVLNGVIYDDIKLELIDHIASEVEAEMQTNQTTFSEAFNNVFDRWKVDFKRTRALFSLGSYYPKIVLNKLYYQIKVQTGTAIVFSLLLFLSLQFLTEANERITFIFWTKKMFFYAFFATLIACLFFKYLNRKVVVLSTYKYRFDLRFPSLLFFLAPAVSDSIPKGMVSQNLYVLSLGFLIVYFSSTIYIGFKHYQFQRKFSIQL